MQQISLLLLLLSGFFSSGRHTHTCMHTLAHTEETLLPLSAHHSSLGMPQREAGGRVYKNRRGLLLCFDGELAPGVACSFGAKARMKEEQKLSHTLQYTLAKIPLLRFFSFPYHGALLRALTACCKQC